MSRVFSVVFIFLFVLLPASARQCRQILNFDKDWLFARYGLQADGSRKAEPVNPFAMNFDDRDWHRLDLPHDWGIEGPFRQDLERGTGNSMNRT